MDVFTVVGRLALEGLSTFQQDVQDAGDGGEKLGSRLGKTFKSVAKVAASTFAFAKITGGIKNLALSTASACDNIDKMSQKIGVSRQAYQELDFICSQSGTSVDNLQAGMKTLVGVMDGAASGTEGSADAFKQLGISVTDSDGNLRSSEDVMWEAFSALQGMENQTEKARLATQLFGRSGTELMPLLNGASGSIEAMKQQAHDLGLVLDDEAIDSGVQFTDALDQMKRSLKAAGQQAGAKLLPLITKVLSKLAPMIAKIMPKLVDALDKMFTTFEPFVDILLNALVDALEWAADNMDTLIPIIAALGAAIGIIMIVLNPIPAAIAAIVAAIVFLVTQWDEVCAWIDQAARDVMGFFGVDVPADWSITQTISDLWNNVCTILGNAWQGVQNFFGVTIPDVWNTMVSAIVEAWQGIGTWISNAGSSVGTFFTESVPTWWNEKVVQPVIDAWNSVKNAIIAAKNAIRDFFIESAGGDLYDESGNRIEPVTDFEKAHVTPNANGLDFVPKDGYMSRLHYGEAVLNRTDAAAWRNGQGGGNDGALAAAIAELSGLMRQVVANTGTGPSIVLDSGVLVGQIAGQMDAQLGAINSRKNRRG